MRAARLHTGNSLKESAVEQARHYVDSGRDAYRIISKKTHKLGKSVDGYVRTYPWLMMGAAAGAGLLLGMMLRRRS